MTNSPILVIGDIMLDKYVDGTVSRISPEAPVPIILVKEETITLGGAGNVAKNLALLQNECHIFGNIGMDENGNSISKVLSELSVQDLCIKTAVQTTVKTRVISKNQQMLRVDREAIYDQPDLAIAALAEILEKTNYKVIIISDYGKGFCSSELLAYLRTKVDKSTKILVDPKGQDWDKYQGSYLITPNQKEAEEIIGRPLKTEDDFKVKGTEIRKKYKLDQLIITRGADGMSLISKDSYQHFPTSKVEVYDVSGAGDTSIAVLAAELNKGEEIEHAIKIANLASSYVVTKPKTYALNKQELDSLLKKVK